jgi:hypothetical protein
MVKINKTKNIITNSYDNSESKKEIIGLLNCIITVVQHAPPALNISQSINWISRQKFIDLRLLRLNGYKNTHPLTNGMPCESNWLIPKEKGSYFGSFAVGGYPDVTEYMFALLSAGIQTFVCLNNEYGKTIGKSKYLEYAKEYKIPAHNFIHQPIADMKIIDDKLIDDVANKIVERLIAGENVYLHCRGGHGRTGTVAGVVLNKLYPQLSSNDIFNYLQYAHDQRDANYFGKQFYTANMLLDPLVKYFVIGQVPTPQTSAQRNQVKRLMV